jgi:peptide/nickel transport system ATP-binding protein
MLAAWLVLLVLAVAAVWPGLLASHPPDAVAPADALAGPSWAHPFGTDQLGRDIYSRVVHGTRLSLSIGLGATAIAVTAGSLIGVLAAAGGRAVDEVIMRGTDILLAFPGLLFALLLVAVLGAGTLNTIIAIGCGAIPAYVRLVRGQALVVRESGYVRAAVTLGRPRAGIFLRHVLPNSLPPALVVATVDVGTAIIAGSSLSFLGLGPQPPTPEWGSMIAEGRDTLDTAWGLAVFPGLLVTVTVIAINVVGGNLRRRFGGDLRSGSGHDRRFVRGLDGPPNTPNEPPAATTGDLLTVEDLRVSFGTGRARIDAVRGIDFSLRAGECLAIVGESGSGKSVTAAALLGLTGPGSQVRAKRLELAGIDLTRLRDRQWREVRGARLGLVPQEGMSSLDPLRTVGAEIAEPLRNHRVVDRTRRRPEIISLLAAVGVPEPELRVRQYPHQLSGGLRQRALIASAMAAGPELLVADEPTTALDVTLQAQILDLIATKKAEGVAVLLISHDLAVAAQLANRIAVMRHGVFVEQGSTKRVLRSPEHRYTRELLAAVPTSRAEQRRPEEGSPSVVIEASGVRKSFRDRPAVRDVSFVLHAGETLGVVGESGAGKTTLAHLVLGLLEPDAGDIRLLGHPWSNQPESARRAKRARVQLIEQDPLSSFDPRYPVERIVGEALGATTARAARLHRARITELLHRVRLDTDILDRRRQQLSGGQRQRVAIARALATEPDVIVCDEPVSALDVSIQARILDLFADLRRELGVALLFISHDLGVIHQISDRVLVMCDGEVVESGSAEDVFRRPVNPYTKTLLAAVPSITM